jgi:2-methylisocitrate lyase-like PEP mutase family enzyme
MSRPQSLGARLAARRQQDAQQALEREEENIDADASMMLSEGLQQALSEMSKVFAEVKTGRSQRE